MEPHRLIRQIRENLGLTQAALAERAGMPQSHLAKIESGAVDPRLGTLRRVLRALGREPVISARPLAASGTSFVGRDGLSLRLVDRQDERDDFEHWLARPAAERVAAVEFLREQYYALSGCKSLPRLAHDVRAVARA